MAQIIELLGDFPLEVKMGGKYSRELFDHTGLFSRLQCAVCIEHHRVQVLSGISAH